MIPVNFEFRRDIEPIPPLPPFLRPPTKSPPTLFECARLRVKGLLLTHLSSEWTRIWLEGHSRSYQFNFSKVAESVQCTLNFLTQGGHLPEGILVTLDLRDDLRKIVFSLDPSAPWTRFMNIIHPSNSRRYSHPRFFARMYVLFSLCAPTVPLFQMIPSRPPVSVEAWVGIMNIE